MRFIIKPENHKNPLLLSSADTYEKLLEISKNIDKDKISLSIYREPYRHSDENMSKVEDQLSLSYYHKCAYCERIAKADIEHYRPKKKVVEDSTHNGYYWLCYEWSNLIPSCVKCNREGGKHSKFPVSGKRIYTPTFLDDGNLNLPYNKANHNQLLEEKPFLLHPEIDNPKDFFSFSIDKNGAGIRIQGKDDGNRGNKTIEICLLNRQELKIERSHIITLFKTAINLIFVKFLNNKLNDDELCSKFNDAIENLVANSNNVELNHTLFRQYIIENSLNFESIVVPYFSTPIKKLLLIAFNNYDF